MFTEASSETASAPSAARATGTGLYYRVPDFPGWLALGVAAIIASSIGGVAGFGTGAMMIPVIAWTLGPKATVPVLTVGMFLGNGARVWFSRAEVNVRVAGAYLVGAVPCGVLGAVLYSTIEAEWLSRLLGGFLLIAVPGRRWLKARGLRVTLPYFPLIGGVFGFLSSLVGAVGPVLSPFFLGAGLLRGAYVSTDALCTVGSYLTRGLVFHRYHLMTESTVTVGLYIGVIMIGGAWIGRKLLDHLSEAAFLRLIETLLVVCGLQMLLWPAR
jgi:uncharacterized membrane protein YfcA